MILGTRGNINPSAPSYGRHSGILIDRRVLLDFGETAYLDYRPRHIFITHLHDDHAAFMRASVTPNADMYVPEPTTKLPNARVISKPLQVGSYRIVPVPTVHSHRLRSVGYVVQHGGRSFFYSSDMISIDRRYHRRFRGVDMVITEGSFIRSGGLIRADPESGERFGHAGIPDLVRFFKPFTQTIVITHFGSWFYKDIAASIRKVEALGDGTRVIAAYDGFTIGL